MGLIQIFVFSIRDSSGNSKLLQIPAFKVDTSEVVNLTSYGITALEALPVVERYPYKYPNSQASRYFKFRASKFGHVQVSFSSSEHLTMRLYHGVGNHKSINNNARKEREHRVFTIVRILWNVYIRFDNPK